MKRRHVISRQAELAVSMLSAQIAAARREKRMTAAEVAERVGISTITLRAVERGLPTVAIGTVFEVATLLGVPLFTDERDQLSSAYALQRGQLALLPSRVREPRTPVRDEF